MLNHPGLQTRKKSSILDRVRRQGPSAGTTYFTPSESASWRQRIERCSQRAGTPLKFAMAHGDDMPLPLEVVRNDQGQVVVHIFRRPDIATEKGERVVQAALFQVFGSPTEGMRDKKTGELNSIFYRDEEAIRVQNGFRTKVLPTDSWYLEFPMDYSMILPDAFTLRDRLAAAVKHQWEVLAG